MLQQIMPEQIPAFWGSLEEMIRKALPVVPGESDGKFNNILTKLLEGVMTCWVAYDDRDGEKVSNGIGITIVVSDDVTETKSLLLYCMATLEGGSPSLQSYQEGMVALRKYAKSKGCDRVTAYTNIDYLINVAKSIGGVASYTFISFPV